jgi:hypothetical protein
MTEFYFKVEGILHAGDTIRPTAILDAIVLGVEKVKGIDVTHAETAMMAQDGIKMEYELSE